MAFKITFVIFASALIVQGIFARSCGCCSGCSSSLPINTGCGCNGNSGLIGSGIGRSISNGLGGGLGGVAVTNGGGLDVTISSAVAPSTVSVLSQNSIDGALEVCGALPVLAAVGIDCALPTSGSASVQYGCGNGNVGITSDCGGYGFGSGYGAGSAGRNGGTLLGGRTGCGCGCGCY